MPQALLSFFVVCMKSIENSLSFYNLSLQYGLKGTCADLLPLRTVHLQSCSGFVTVSCQRVDVIQPLHEEDSIHFKYLYLYGCVLAFSWWLCTVHVYRSMKSVVLS